MPAFLRALIARVRAMFHRDTVAGEIHDELAFHLKMRVEEYERRGFTRDEARARAVSRVGNVAVHQDRGYDVRGGGFVETVAQDVKYSVRLLRKQPAFTAVAVMTLALGVGVSTALFSVIDAALLHPLPYDHPEELMQARIRVPQPDGRVFSVRASIADARDWRSANGIVTGTGTMSAGFSPVVDAGGGPERVPVNDITEGFLDLCGITPIVGRDVTASDVAVDAPRVVLLGYGYWQTRFAGDRNIVGRAVKFTDGTATVIGVLPAHFYRKVAIWRATPLGGTITPSRRGMGNDTVIRLRPGVRMADAERELTTITQRADAMRGTPGTVSVELKSMRDEASSGYGSTLSILGGAVGFIVLIGCVNVAGLLLARGATRRPEMAIRASIGAGRARLVRQLLTESVVLACAGGIAGVLLAWLSLDALLTIVPMTLPGDAAATLNGTALAFALAVAIITALLFGLIPAMRLSRVDLRSSANAGNRHGSGLSRRGGQSLIAIEIALAAVLLAGAGLLIRSFMALMSTDVGFDPDAIVTMEVAPLEQKPGVLTPYYPAAIDAISHIPGVAAVGAVTSVPMGPSRSLTSAQVPNGPRVIAVSRWVTPGYASALGLRVVQGRVPEESPVAPGPASAMLNEEAAKALFLGTSPIGRTINVPPNGLLEVVAVVGGTHQDGPMRDVGPEILTIARPPLTRVMTLVIRPVSGARISHEQLRRAASGTGTDVFVERIRNGSDWIDDSVVTQRHRTLLFGLLGGLGMLLTLVGVFGTTAYAVARRTQEIGVRMAFGARPGQVVRAIVVDAAWPVVAGTAIGLGGAMLTTKVIAKFLFRTTPTDPVTFAAVVVVLASAGALAAWLPARRAARVNPVTALRTE
jgi:predicted permease